MQDGMPVYVKINDYKQVLDALNSIKTKLHEAKENINQVIDLKHQEDAEIDSWKMGLEDIEQKVAVVDKSLFELHNGQKEE
ncbi:MAG: tetrahydromethanopterin S-methyltransferase subunit G [Candidatus Woesearchaeota archaeon]|jgi:tetrahydromethanopterin S-methyltransferase subunit G